MNRDQSISCPRRGSALYIIIVLAVLLAVPGTRAQRIVRKQSLAADTAAMLARIPSERVIVGTDTVSVVIPEHNFGRYDRGLYNYLYMPKGKWAFGLTASYGALNTDDIQILSVLNNVDLNGKLYSINPEMQYFFKSNQSVGLKFNYSRGQLDLNNLSLDISDDMSFSISDISYDSRSTAFSVFYRNYVGLGMDKRFAVFNEVDLGIMNGVSHFKRIFDGEPRDTRTLTKQLSLNFSPGLSVFLQDNMACTVSFGVFGLKLRSEDQNTNGVDEGRRVTSGANFRFNIFNIAFGMMIVL